MGLGRHISHLCPSYEGLNLPFSSIFGLYNDALTLPCHTSAETGAFYG